MKIKKKVLISVMLIATVIMVWAGGQSDSGTAGRSAVISFWHWYIGSTEYQINFNNQFERFKRANPDIVFEIEEVTNTSGGPSMATRIATAMAANDMPDIYQYWGGVLILTQASQGVLMDVSEYLRATRNFKYEEIDQSAWDYYTINGVIRGFPSTGFIPGWFCNKELFERFNLDYPKTMNDVYEISKVFTANGIIPLAQASSGGNPGHFFLSELTHQYPGGTRAIQELGRTSQFNTDSLVKAAQTILDLRAAGAFPQDTVANGDWTPSFELYNGERAAMLYTNSWAYSNMRDEILNKSVLIDVPAVVNGGTINPNDFVQSSANDGWCVSQSGWSNPAKQQQIVRIMDWILSDELTQSLVDGGLVHVKTTNIKYDSRIMSMVDDFYREREKVPAHFSTMRNIDVYRSFTRNLDLLFAGSISAIEYADLVQRAFEQ